MNRAISQCTDRKPAWVEGELFSASLGWWIWYIYSCWCDQTVHSLHLWIVWSLAQKSLWSAPCLQHWKEVCGFPPFFLVLERDVSLEALFWCLQTQLASNFCLSVVKRDSCMWLGVYWLSDLKHKCFLVSCAVPQSLSEHWDAQHHEVEWGLHQFRYDLLLLPFSLATQGDRIWYWEFRELMPQVGYKIHNHQHHVS